MAVWFMNWPEIGTGDREREWNIRTYLFYKNRKEMMARERFTQISFSLPPPVRVSDGLAFLCLMVTLILLLCYHYLKLMPEITGLGITCWFGALILILFLQFHLPSKVLAFCRQLTYWKEIWPELDTMKNLLIELWNIFFLSNKIYSRICQV